MASYLHKIFDIAGSFDCLVTVKVGLKAKCAISSLEMLFYTVICHILYIYIYYVFDISQLWDKIETCDFHEDLPLESPHDFD